jgi:hypothetical protein
MTEYKLHEVIGTKHYLRASGKDLTEIQKYALQNMEHWFVTDKKDKILALSYVKFSTKPNKKSTWSKIKEFIKI